MTYAETHYTDGSEKIIENLIWHENTNDGWIKIITKNETYYVSSKNVYFVAIKEGEDT